jgi:hypothetical protein
MDLGPYASYGLPAQVRSAYGVDTAQELADQLGVTKQPTAALSGEAEDAYKALRNGDSAPARTLLVERLGVSEARADEAIAKLPQL